MTDFTGTREAFAAALMDIAENDANAVLVSSDSLKAMRATAFAEKHPSQYIEAGIAEQAAVAAAAGMAASGLTPFVATYAGFLTMRACEQMRTFTAYPNLNVKFIGVNAGVVGGEREGVTHQFYEDLGILSSIPNFSIFTPADAAQTYQAVLEAYRVTGPVYIRAGSGREAEIYDKSAPFNPDGVTVLRNYGNAAVVFTSGFILDRVLAAADMLKEEGINISIADVNILYGDGSKLLDIMKNTSQVFTVEDHNINGGLGSYICHLACENAPVRVKRIGLDRFPESGPAKELADHYGFSPETLAAAVKSQL